MMTIMMMTIMMLMMMMMMLAFQFKVLHLLIIVILLIVVNCPGTDLTSLLLPKPLNGCPRSGSPGSRTKLALFSSHCLSICLKHNFVSHSSPFHWLWFWFAFRSPSHPIHLSRSAEALFWDSRLQPSSRDFLEILDVTAHPFPEPPVPLPTSQKMWSWQKVIDISQSTL